MKVAIRNELHGNKDQYFKNIKEKLKKNGIILRNELKNLLHLCQTSSDVELARKIIYRYHEQNRIRALHNFKFGPLFMRLCYELDLERPAVELIKDQNLHGFFSDSTSFHILMTMLFKKGHFESALEVLVEMKKQGIPFNKETYLLAVAICYKLGNPESSKISVRLLEEAQLKGDMLPLRAYCFAMATALKQNDVAQAKFYCSQIMRTENKLYNNLKVLVQLRSGLLKEVINTLEAAVEVDTPPFVKRTQFSVQVGNNMRPILLHVPVNDLDDREFSRRKPASDTKPGDGRCAGGHAKKNLTSSRACRNEVSGASESLTRTSLKPWCSSTENGLSGWKLSWIVPKPNLSLSAQQQDWREQEQIRTQE
ncbi:pentatricopeptide repeat-containing protein 2, mitochondrial isoform X3 [Lonchura striata]